MPDAFTVYWNRERVDCALRGGLASRAIPFLYGGPHLSQPSFIRAGVAPGDTVYPVSLRGTEILVLASFVVGEILTAEEFMARHPDLYPPDSGNEPFGKIPATAARRLPWHKALCRTCWDHVLLPAESSPVRGNAGLPPDAALRLTFRSKKAERLLRWTSDGKRPLLGSLDRIYRLAPHSAGDLRQAFLRDCLRNPHHPPQPGGSGPENALGGDFTTPDKAGTPLLPGLFSGVPG